MTAVGDNSTNVTDRDVDALAWQFLRSDHPESERADEPLNRRLDCFLRHCGLGRLPGSGDIYNIILNRVVSYISVLDHQQDQRML
jgi:hypothetical protein